MAKMTGEEEKRRQVVSDQLAALHKKYNVPKGGILRRENITKENPLSIKDKKFDREVRDRIKYETRDHVEQILSEYRMQQLKDFSEENRRQEMFAEGPAERVKPEEVIDWLNSLDHHEDSLKKDLASIAHDIQSTGTKSEAQKVLDVIESLDTGYNTIITPTGADKLTEKVGKQYGESSTVDTLFEDNYSYRNKAFHAKNTAMKELSKLNDIPNIDYKSH